MLKAKRHLLLEKPIAVTLAASRRLIAAHQAHCPDKVFMVAENAQYWPEIVETGRLLEEARGYAEAGFLGMKTKVGGLSIAEDVARVRAIREAIGPQVQLMIDANEACECRSSLSGLSPTI